MFHLKNLISWKCIHTQAIQDLDEFTSSSEQIWRNVTLHHLLTNASSAVNGCRQNESPNCWFKTSQSPTWHQFISCKGKSCMCVINKSVKMLLKKSPSLAVFSHTNPPTYLFRAVLGCFIKYWKCLLLHLFLYPSVFHGFISYHDELDSCCDNDFYQLGLSFWRHPFSPEDSLQSKWCNAKFEVLMKTRWGWPDSICWAKFWQFKWRCC